MKDTLEFYLADSQRPFLIVDSALQPDEGDLVSIRNTTYKVIGRSYAVDYADQSVRRARCNLIVEKYERK